MTTGCQSAAGRSRPEERTEMLMMYLGELLAPLARWAGFVTGLLPW